MALVLKAFVSPQYPTGCRAMLMSSAKQESVKSCRQKISRRYFAGKGLLSIATVIMCPAPISAQLESRKDEGLFSRIYKQQFAKALESMEASYETGIASTKAKLFKRIRDSDVVADIGIGTGPNLKYMPKGVKVFGVDPNQYMWPYASKKAGTYNVDLTLLEGVAEDIPLEDSSCDVVITTLTLCSVGDLGKATQEILRILKPGGQHLFIEHVVASRDRPILRGAQNVLNPLQVAVAGGCHLNRDTGNYLKQVGNPDYSEIEFESFDVSLGPLIDKINPTRPHVSGFARKVSL